MTRTDTTALRKYFRSISSLLPCGGKQKRLILGTARNNVAVYLQDHPDADFAQIQQHFGTPEEIAAAFVSDMDMPELLGALRSRRRVFVAVIAALIAALLLWGGGVALTVADQHNANPSYFVDG